MVLFTYALLFTHALLFIHALAVGYNTLDGFSGGFVFGAGGSGLITPRFGVSPERSGVNTPLMSGMQSLTQGTINAAFVDHVGQDGIKIDV